MYCLKFVNNTIKRLTNRWQQFRCCAIHDIQFIFITPRITKHLKKSAQLCYLFTLTFFLWYLYMEWLVFSVWKITYVLYKTDIFKIELIIIQNATFRSIIFSLNRKQEHSDNIKTVFVVISAVITFPTTSICFIVLSERLFSDREELVDFLIPNYIFKVCLHHFFYIFCLVYTTLYHTGDSWATHVKLFLWGQISLFKLKDGSSVHRYSSHPLVSQVWPPPPPASDGPAMSDCVTAPMTIHHVHPMIATTMGQY